MQNLAAFNKSQIAIQLDLKYHLVRRAVDPVQMVADGKYNMATRSVGADDIDNVALLDGHRTPPIADSLNFAVTTFAIRQLTSHCERERSPLPTKTPSMAKLQIPASVRELSSLREFANPDVPKLGPALVPEHADIAGWAAQAGMLL